MGAILLVIGLIIVGAAVVVGRGARRTAESTGLSVAQIAVVYSDSGAWEKVEESLFSESYGLTGKPDYVVETKDGLVPIELKPLRQADQPYESDVMQLAAYCLLLEEAWDETPPYGLLRYKDKTFQIRWTDELREELLATLNEMRELMDFEAYQDGPLPAPQHDMTVRCQNCGFHYICWK